MLKYLSVAAAVFGLMVVSSSSDAQNKRHPAPVDPAQPNDPEVIEGDLTGQWDLEFQIPSRRTQNSTITQGPYRF